MKVFSREKYLMDFSEISPSMAEERRIYEWPFECDGKTKEECNALGYGVHPDWMEESEMKVFSREKYLRVPVVASVWMEEKEMGYKEKQADWLKVNNLREGSRVYVYRKPEDHENGWKYAWVDALMDEAVGKVGNIVAIHLHSLLVKVGNKTSFMPYTALLPVGVTEFEVGRRYKYVGAGGTKRFIDIGINDNDAEVLGKGCELMVEEFYGRGVKFTVFDREWYFTLVWEDFVALPEKDYYKELDRWIKANDLKVGDKVRILRSPTLEDMEGWECTWDAECDKYVGKVLTVDEFCDEDNEIGVKVDDVYNMYVPYTVLEKVRYNTYLDLDKALESVGITTTSATLRGRLWPFDTLLPCTRTVIYRTSSTVGKREQCNDWYKSQSDKNVCRGRRWQLLFCT